MVDTLNTADLVLQYHLENEDLDGLIDPKSNDHIS
jgi:hypothetical protein